MTTKNSHSSMGKPRKRGPRINLSLKDQKPKYVNITSQIIKNTPGIKMLNNNEFQYL